MRNAIAAVGFFVLSAVPGALAQAGGDELPPWLSERRIIGHNDLEPIESVQGTSLYDYSRIVARMENREGVGFCTASRLGPDLFLTNYHCFQVSPCNDVQFRMGYERALPPANQAAFKCSEVLAKNLTLDYALFRVENVADDLSDSALAFPAATLSTSALRVGQALMLASHPSARPKEIDHSATCVVRTAEWELTSERKTITHTCDTEGGSSGSPVIDRATGAVVALHWGGDNDYNFAIPMSLIVDDLRANLGADDFEKLVLRP